MEAVLRVRNRKVITTPDFENAMELFLTEFPSGEIRSGKRRLGGCTTTCRKVKEKRASNDKRKGLDLSLSSSESDSDSDNNNIRVQPGESLDHYGHSDDEISSHEYNTSSDSDLDTDLDY